MTVEKITCGHIDIEENRIETADAFLHNKKPDRCVSAYRAFCCFYSQKRIFTKNLYDQKRS